MYYEEQYHIDARDADHRGQCRISALLGILQENGAAAAASLGLSRREMLEKYHGFWMLARIWVELERPICLDDIITVRTWHRPSKGAISYRDFDLYRDGAWIGQAVSAWVIADAESHKLLRSDKVREFAASSGEGLGKTRTLSHIKLPEGAEQVEKRRLQYSEQDVNGHINNTRYADYACDALRMEDMGNESFIRSIQLGFLAECHAGDELTLLVSRQGDLRYVSGHANDGKPRFDAVLEIENGDM